VVVNAVINSGPREDSTRIGRAGTVRRQAVDVSPLRRVNQAISLLTTGAREASFRNIKTIAECLADELINAAKVKYIIYYLFHKSPCIQFVRTETNYLKITCL
jgi:small subunit ribosomal protein S5e